MNYDIMTDRLVKILYLEVFIMKTNLTERKWACIIFITLFAYWIPIVLSILNYLKAIEIAMLIVYLICIVVVSKNVIRNISLVITILFVMIAESIQLVPYGLILFIKELFV